MVIPTTKCVIPLPRLNICHLLGFLNSFRCTHSYVTPRRNESRCGSLHTCTNDVRCFFRATSPQIQSASSPRDAQVPCSSRLSHRFRRPAEGAPSTFTSCLGRPMLSFRARPSTQRCCPMRIARWKAPMLSKLLRSVVIDGSDNGAEAELKLHLRDDSPRQVAVQEERAAPPYDA